MKFEAAIDPENNKGIILEKEVGMPAGIATYAEISQVRRQGTTPFVVGPARADGIIVKGFISTDRPDREGLRIEPQEFDLESYMAKPAVLVNHALWADAQGIRGGVGYPLSMHVVKVRRGPDASTLSIYDIATKKEVDVVQRTAFPSVSVGTQGLYGFIKISNPDVVQMVQRGELKAFSWRGVGNWGHMADNAIAYRTLRGIDLWEVSLVTMPMNGDSYAVMKSAIVGVTSAEDLTSTFLADRVGQLLTVDAAGQGEIIRMLGGLSFKMAVAPEAAQQPVEIVSMTIQSSATPVATPQAAPPVAVDPAVVEQTSSAPAPAVEAPVTAPAVAPQALTIEEVMRSFAPLFSGIVDGQKVLASSVSSMQEMQKSLVDTLAGVTAKLAEISVVQQTSTPAVTPAPAEEPVTQAELLRGLSEIHSKVGAMQQTLGSIVPPARGPRSESSTPAPAPASVDPNSVFDNLFARVPIRK